MCCWAMDGTFQPPTTHPSGQYPNSVVAGDFNGDGILDLALSSGGLAIFLGNGDGTLQSPISPDAGLLSRIASLELAAMQKSNRSELSTVTLGEYSLLGSARVSGQLRQGKQGPKAWLFVSAKHRSRKRISLLEYPCDPFIPCCAARLRSRKSSNVSGSHSGRCLDIGCLIVCVCWRRDTINKLVPNAEADLT